MIACKRMNIAEDEKWILNSEKSNDILKHLKIMKETIQKSMSTTAIQFNLQENDYICYDIDQENSKFISEEQKSVVIHIKRKFQHPTD